MLIKKITVLIGLILFFNHIVAQNIHEQERIKGIQAVFQAKFEDGINIIEKNINHPSIDETGKSIAMISLQAAYLYTNSDLFN